MSLARRMLQQALRVSGRSSFPLVKWMERWAEGAAAGSEGTKTHGVKTLDDMPGPSVASFAWDLFARRGLSRLHELQVRRSRHKRLWGTFQMTALLSKIQCTQHHSRLKTRVYYSRRGCKKANS